MKIEALLSSSRWNRFIFWYCVSGQLQSHIVFCIHNFIREKKQNTAVIKYCFIYTRWKKQTNKHSQIHLQTNVRIYFPFLVREKRTQTTNSPKENNNNNNTKITKQITNNIKSTSTTVFYMHFVLASWTQFFCDHFHFDFIFLNY